MFFHQKIKKNIFKIYQSMNYKRIKKCVQMCTEIKYDTII